MQLKVYKWRRAHTLDDTYDSISRWGLYADKDLRWDTWSIKITYED